jgi:hypothetical protein
MPVNIDSIVQSIDILDREFNDSQRHMPSNTTVRIVFSFCLLFSIVLDMSHFDTFLLIIHDLDRYSIDSIRVSLQTIKRQY